MSNMVRIIPGSDIADVSTCLENIVIDLLTQAPSSALVPMKSTSTIPNTSIQSTLAHRRAP